MFFVFTRAVEAEVVGFFGSAGRSLKLQTFCLWPVDFSDFHLALPQRTRVIYMRASLQLTFPIDFCVTCYLFWVETTGPRTPVVYLPASHHRQIRVPGMSTRNDKPPSRGLLDFTCPSTSCRHPVCADYFSLNISIQSHSVGSNPVGRQLSFFLDNVSITASYVVMSRLLLLFFLSSCVSILYSCFSPLTRQPVSRWRLISDRFLSVTLFVESLDAPQGRLPSINYLPGNLLSSLLFQCQSSMHAVDVC